MTHGIGHVSVVLALQGQSITTIEPDNEINDVCHVPNSGLVLMAMDHTTLLSYYIPVSFGPCLEHFLASCI